MAEMYIGTIHAFCLDLLKTEVPINELGKQVLFLGLRPVGDSAYCHVMQTQHIRHLALTVPVTMDRLNTCRVSLGLSRLPLKQLLELGLLIYRYRWLRGISAIASYPSHSVSVSRQSPRSPTIPELVHPPRSKVRRSL